jgi:hypothetical protein
LLLTTAIFGAGCARESNGAQTPAGGPSIVEIASPAGAGAAEPFLFAARDSILLSWLEPVPDTKKFALRFARYRNGRWTAPQTIVERDDLFVNWADFPSVVEDEKGTLFAHWLQKSGAATYAYDVRMATSSDGRSWSEPFLLNRDGTRSEHGFVSLAALPKGGVAATWLDGRKMKSGGGHEHDGGDMTVRYAEVSADGSLRGETELDARACECCATGMTLTAHGPLIVYRDRSAEEVRDIARVGRTASGWTAPTRVRADQWKINACPVNGPQIDAIGDRVATAWFTAAQEKGRVFAAFSDDGGVSFGNAVQVDEGKPIGRVDILLLDPDNALVTWIEQTAGGGAIRARRVHRTGTMQPSVKIADSSTARAAGFPRIARLGSDIYVAWTDQSAETKKLHLARGRP